MDDIFYNITRVDWSEHNGRDLLDNSNFSDELQYPTFVDWLTGESARGRKLILATASDRLVAEIPQHMSVCSTM